MSLVNHKTLGIQGKTLIGAVGSTPTVVLGDDQEVNLNCDNSRAKYATRGHRRNNSRITTQDLSVDLTVVKDFTNPSFVLLYNACMASEPIAAKFLDNASGFGWDGDWNFSMKEGQPQDGFTTVQFTGDHTSDYRELTEIVPDDE